MKIKFIAGFTPIASNPTASMQFYRDAIGIDFEHEINGYYYTEALQGAKHFGVWPLKHAAISCFGSENWPTEYSIPQATLEFEVENVSEAEQELLAQGYQLIHTTREEPWKQITARLLSPEGLLIGLVKTPWLV